MYVPHLLKPERTRYCRNDYYVSERMKQKKDDKPPEPVDSIRFCEILLVSVGNPRLSSLVCNPEPDRAVSVM